MLSVRDGNFDVLVLAGPRIRVWPSAGVRALSVLCTEMGLTVGCFGGDMLTARGVIPLPGTGGIGLIEDAQSRIHRIHGRSIVKVGAPMEFPDPFLGSDTPGLIPLSTAESLFKSARLDWTPAVAILGTGNPGLRLGTRLLESGQTNEVYCIESFTQWGSKRYAGWEVERRRFEMLGGKIIEARPVSLARKGALFFELRVEDSRGLRVLEVARVIAAGPFRPSPGIREYPEGSSLFELEQSAPFFEAEDVSGWNLEIERGRLLAGKIVKRLALELGPIEREALEKHNRRARIRLKRFEQHLQDPFMPAYQGKWISPVDAKKIRQFSGVPKSLQQTKPIASIECFETIGCDLCARACPEKAIELTRSEIELLEDRCTACGICVAVCPSATPVLVESHDEKPTGKLTVAWRNSKPWKPGELATFINRRGETLGAGRVDAELTLDSTPGLSLPEGTTLVRLDVPAHLAWEARGIRKLRQEGAEDPKFMRALQDELVPSDSTPVEIFYNGEKRLVRNRIPVIQALFEMGNPRPEDGLYCPDGSCGRCALEVDGVKKLACQTTVHPRMSIRLNPSPFGVSPPGAGNHESLCHCLAIKRSQVVDKIRQGKLHSPEAVLAVTHVGEGRCHGGWCCEPFRRVLNAEGIDADQWIDWRFPWMDWKVTPGSAEE